MRNIYIYRIGYPRVDLHRTSLDIDLQARLIDSNSIGLFKYYQRNEINSRQ